MLNSPALWFLSPDSLRSVLRLGSQTYGCICSWIAAEPPRWWGSCDEEALGAHLGCGWESCCCCPYRPVCTVTGITCSCPHPRSPLFPVDAPPGPVALGPWSGLSRGKLCCPLHCWCFHSRQSLCTLCVKTLLNHISGFLSVTIRTESDI